VRRPGLRPLSAALESVARGAAPATTLARVQEHWREVAGPTVAAESEPSSERDGTVTVSCSSAVWAQELELLSPDLLEGLNAALGAGPVRALRFVATRPPRRP
jgi:predicted nucleic acid-binding Zn ribbon protein